MKTQYRLLLAVLVAALALFSGCSGKKPEVRMIHHDDGQRKEPLPQTAPYQLKISPVIGSQQDDAKVVRDFGVILKTWIAPYQDSSGYMVASHEIYVVAKEPEWIGAETLPKKATGSRNPTGALPFALRPEGVDNTEGFTNDEIREYVNEVYKVGQTNEPALGKEERDNNSSKAILEFIKQEKKNGGLK